jgi:hypothetical protein
MEDLTSSTSFEVEGVRCDECPLGRVYSHGRGGFCPRLLKSLAPSEILLEASSPDEPVWFIKEGVFAIEIGERVHLILPGSLMSVDDLRRYGETAVLRSLTRSTVCWAPGWATHDRACEVQPKTTATV